MTMNGIPWDDDASLIRELGGGDREIAAEGPLKTMVREVTTLDRSAWWQYRIVLPDRPVEPFSFEKDRFDFLLEQMKYDQVT